MTRLVSKRIVIDKCRHYIPYTVYSILFLYSISIHPFIFFYLFCTKWHHRSLLISIVYREKVGRQTEL